MTWAGSPLVPPHTRLVPDPEEQPQSRLERARPRSDDPDPGLLCVIADDFYLVPHYKPQDAHYGDKIVWPSEVLWQYWKSTALGAGTPAFHLRAIIRLTIINEASQIAISKASQHSPSSKIDDHNQIEYTRLNNGFYAILRSPNGAIVHNFRLKTYRMSSST
jgi:hypothetical protein